MKRDAQHYLELGDRLVRRGKLDKAAAAYARYADAWMAETFFTRARTVVRQDPVEALRALMKAERLIGATAEGRRLSAEAYFGLGKPEIALKFLDALGVDTRRPALAGV
jgi:hypothetical protein